MISRAPRPQVIGAVGAHERPIHLQTAVIRAVGIGPGAFVPVDTRKRPKEGIRARALRSRARSDNKSGEIHDEYELGTEDFTVPFMSLYWPRGSLCPRLSYASFSALSPLLPVVQPEQEVVDNRGVPERVHREDEHDQDQEGERDGHRSH